MLTTKLQEIGFTQREAEVYEILLKLGKSKVNTILKQAQVSYSKLYEILDRLVNKGVASRTYIENVKHYEALPINSILEYLERKKESISKTQAELKKIIPKIEKSLMNNTKQNVRMHIGKEGPLIALQELEKESIKSGSNYGYGTDVNPYEQLYPQDLKKFVASEKRHKFKTFLLFAKGTKHNQPNAKLKFIESQSLPPVRTMISGDKVFLVDFTQPITTIIIESGNISKNYIDHFQTLWKSASK